MTFQAAQRPADDLVGREVLGLGARVDGVLEVRVEANRNDR